MFQKIKQIIQKNYKWIILFLCVVLFLAILEDLFEQETLKIDTIVFQIVVENMRSAPLTILLKGITQLGSAPILILIVVGCLIFLKNKKIGMSISINLLLSATLNYALKNIIERPRPEGYRLIAETGYSFPSGHSMVNTAFYGLLIYLIWKNIKNPKVRNSSCIFLRYFNSINWF